MPRVRMRTIIAGPNVQGDIGQTITVDDDTAKALVRDGFGEIVNDPPPSAREHEPEPEPETETVEAGEDAVVEPGDDATSGPSEAAVLPRRGPGRRRK